MPKFPVCYSDAESLIKSALPRHWVLTELPILPNQIVRYRQAREKHSLLDSTNLWYKTTSVEFVPAGERV